MTQFLQASGFLDQLFLTSAPSLFGRFEGDGRKSLVNGLDLAGVRVLLASVRRHQSHLFLRYRVAPGINRRRSTYRQRPNATVLLV